MYGPRPIRFSAHWCADYSKYRGFLAGGISTASSLLPFLGTRLRRQNFNFAPFVVHKVLNARPLTYKIIDLLGEPMKGSFYKQELQKVKQVTYRFSKY